MTDKNTLAHTFISKDELQLILNKNFSHTVPNRFYYLGNKSCLRQPIVGIIGSRHPTAYGREQAFRFAKELSQAGCSILSGGAIGIDTIANETAHNQKGFSIAVIGSGIEHLYPSSNSFLFEKMKNSGHGLILSEFEPREPPLRWNFPKRNHSIALLCDFVLVIEAAKTSGSLITANAALDLGVDVGAVPGTVDSPNSEGTNALIQNGAFCIQTARDVLDRVSSLLTR